MKLGVMLALLAVGTVELRIDPNEGDHQDEGLLSHTVNQRQQVDTSFRRNKSFPGILTAKSINDVYTMDTLTKSKSIATLEKPTWVDTAGFTKGSRHDRQHLGIILAAGQRIKIRQTNESFTKELRIRLLNDDRNTETSRDFGATWVEVSLDAVSVPFVDTPLEEGAPKIEFEYPSTAKALPVYNTGEKESYFFDSWDTQDAEFALVVSDYFRMMVPKMDKDRLKSMGAIKNIDEMIQIYDGIFTFYNSLAGLSFEAESDTDRNIKSRYFIKADAFNWGYVAYYSEEWTAANTKSIANCWLEPRYDKWCHLHEIGHGYEGHFAKDKHFRTVDVWNNVYATCYQDVMLGDMKYEKGWLYGGDFPAFEKRVTDHIVQAKPVAEWELGEKLYFMMLMVHKVGKNTLSHFNQKYRKDSNTDGFVAADHVLLDMLSESFAYFGNEVDVTPFVQLVGGYMTPAQINRNYFSHAKAVYPLNQLVKAEVLEKVKIQLKLDFMMSLVDSEQLKVTGLKGSVKLRLNIDDFSQISGEVLMLMEGSRYAFKAQINCPEIVLNDMPIGVYTLRLPTGKDKKYQFHPTYLVLKQGESEAEVTFVRKKSSKIISQEIYLHGYYDYVFAIIAVNQDQGMITIKVNKSDPHFYFKNETYAQVTVKSKNGSVIFSREILATHEKLTHDEIPFETGDTIEIYHWEPFRLKSMPPYPDVNDVKARNNTLLITKSGLKNEALNYDPEKDLLPRLEKAVLYLRNFHAARNADYSTYKDDIFLAIDVFGSPKREELLELYQDCLPSYY